MSYGEKLYTRHFKGKHGKLYIVGKVNTRKSQEKYESSPQKKIPKNRENDHVSIN